MPMTRAEMDAIANDIDKVTLALTGLPALETASVQACAMAFALAAANHVIHGMGSKEDFMNLVEAAWTKASGQHGTTR